MKKAWKFFKRGSKEIEIPQGRITDRRASSFPRKRKDEKNLYNIVKGKHHLLHHVTFTFERSNFRLLLRNALRIEHRLDSDLTVFQFCMIAFIQNQSLFHIDYIFQLSIQYGIVLTIFLYMLSTFLISMPIYIIFLTMASYSRKGPIAFWDCAPLMKGFAFSWALASIIKMAANLQIFSTCLHRLMNINEFHSDVRCESGYQCKNNDTMYLDTNCTSRHFMLDYERGRLLLVNTNSLNALKILCILCFLAIVIWISIRGLHATKKLLQVLFILCEGLISIIMFALMLTPVPYNVNTDIFTLRHDPLFSVKYWSMITPISLQLVRAGDTIWLGRFKPKKIRPDIFSILLHILRYFHFLIIFCWMMHIVQEIIGKYGISAECLYTKKFSILLIAVPDMLLHHYPSGFACVLWFFVLGTFSLVVTCYEMICLLDGFLELKEVKNKKKYLVSVVFILVACFTILFTCTSENNIMIYWSDLYTRPWLCFQLFAQCMSTIHIYSIKRFVHDYEFTYKRQLGKAWMKMWQGISIYVLMLVVVAVHWVLTLIEQFSGENVLSIFYPTVMWISLTIPTLVLFVLHSCKYLKKHTMYRSTWPLPSWRPFERSDWVTRMQFLPDRDIKYRHHSVTCAHVCLVKLKSFRAEKKLQKMRFYKLASKFAGGLDKYGDAYTSSDDEGMRDSEEHLDPELIEEHQYAD